MRAGRGWLWRSTAITTWTGICACALMTQALRRFGLRADPHTPLREEGYGLNLAAVEQLAKDYRVLVTVDLGITNHEEVRLAQRLGMRVIVTDHHGLGLEASPRRRGAQPTARGTIPSAACAARGWPSSWRRRCWGWRRAGSIWTWRPWPPWRTSCPL